MSPPTRPKGDASLDFLMDFLSKELAELRRENREDHNRIWDALETRLTSHNGRIRKLEHWRAYLVGIGAGMAGGASWIVNKLFG
jgi:hypothetical protein